MTAELRPEWLCLGCAMRVYNVCRDAIPAPRKWEDGRCPRCRINLARETEGAEAANKLADNLLHGERGGHPFKRPIAKRDDGQGQEKPKQSILPGGGAGMKREGATGELNLPGRTLQPNASRLVNSASSGKTGAAYP